MERLVYVRGIRVRTGAEDMKTKREILREIERLTMCEPKDADLYGRINALRWVLEPRRITRKRK